ncbi:MAG: STAS domain-containing protein, partial [Ottowia sp.]|nr:STAS domain-containing protein [Ottowia sp.]
DVEGAEQGLLALIGEGGEHQDEVDTWLTLFDLYRASGEQLKFDELSVQFAGRFGRSAPQWSRGTDGGPAIPKKITAPAPTPSGQVHWTCPSALGAQSLATLNAAIARAASPWRIDWRYLKSIDPATLPALTEIFNRWADTDGRFKFLGTDTLLQLLEENAPTEDRDVDPQWWKTHLALLRVLDEMDEFDMVALNYCITYEVSPPPWMPPKCKYSPMDEEGQTLLPNDFGEEAAASSGGLSSSRVPFQDTRPTAAPTRLPDDDGIVRAELEGELLISAADVLAPLAALTARQAFAIDCRHLQRVDFGAAGDLLNWAMTLHSGGHSVTFHSVNRIVAAFFGVVGLNQAARITLRRD